MLVERIHAYLRNSGKTMNEAVLDTAIGSFRYMLQRRFMQDDPFNPTGRMYTTLITHPCARKAAYSYYGFKGEAMEPRSEINFFCGDMVELGVMVLARAAGCDIATPREIARGEKMRAVYGDESISCWPDGLAQSGDTWQNIEIKKMSDYVFDRAERNHGPTDEWGYVTQASLEVLSWRALSDRLGLNLDIKGTLMLAVRGLTGHLAEWFLPYNEDLAQKAFARKRAVEQAAPDRLPPRAFRPVTIQAKDGKKPTKNEGRKKLGMQCGYCAFKQHCWPGINTEFERGRPVFFVEEPVQEVLIPGGTA